MIEFLEANYNYFLGALVGSGFTASVFILIMIKHMLKRK